MYRNILIPTDGSELSQKAVVQGVELAKALGAKVTAYFAAPPATPKVLGLVDATAKSAGVPCESLHTTSDFPEDEILKIAAKRNCDLIVMATHGQGGLRGVFIGSVTQKVLNLAKVPVLVIR